MTPPTRPPFPHPTAKCPECGAVYATTVHEPLCPRKIRQQELQDAIARDRARLFGIEWGGADE